MANKFWVEDIENNPGVAYQETQPSPECIDRTDNMVYWNKYGMMVQQYLQVRNEIWRILILEAGSNLAGFSSLSDEKKLICANWILLPYSYRIQIVSESVDKDNFKECMEETSGFFKDKLSGRSRIVEEMRQFVGLNYFRNEIMSKNDIDDFYNTCTGMLNEFISSNSINFRYWLNNQVGSNYENDGFAQKNYYNINIVEGFNTILNGIY